MIRKPGVRLSVPLSPCSYTHNPQPRSLLRGAGGLTIFVTACFFFLILYPFLISDFFHADVFQKWFVSHTLTVCDIPPGFSTFEYQDQTCPTSVSLMCCVQSACLDTYREKKNPNRNKQTNKKTNVSFIIVFCFSPLSSVTFPLCPVLFCNVIVAVDV